MVGRNRPGPDPKYGSIAQTGAERFARFAGKRKAERLQNIAVLDFETDPFDNVRKTIVRPFAACLYSEHDTVVIWEENYERFISEVIRALEALPGRFTVYAHNGGKFDFMFLVSRLRGNVSFKGRGIMSARLCDGRIELRDSFHIIPERLANWQKDDFDYSKLTKSRRGKFKEEIIKYMVNDCRYLFSIVRAFLDQFGLKISIGQAAMAELKKHYEVEKFTEGWDSYVRQFFFGGRVECLRGRGNFRGDYKLYDVNSMYPFVMADYAHPIGGFADYRVRGGAVGIDTVFIDLECENRGALIARDQDGNTTANVMRGRFFTTIWEFEVAAKYNLISNVKINYCVDCAKRTDFAKFVNPLYEKRLITKGSMAELKSRGLETSAAFFDLKKDDIFYKLLLNNAYGKFAQNPRRFKEYYITDPGETPPAGWMRSIEFLPKEERNGYYVAEYECDQYWIWRKPSPAFSYNNVGTAASITGAARSVLLEAMQHADDAIYCDTDSIICRDLDREIDKIKLGAWDIENEFSEVRIAGKKLYAVEPLKPYKRTTEQLARGLSPLYEIKSKGTAGLDWLDMDQLINYGAVIPVKSRGPTLDRFGGQEYMTRNIRATAPIWEQT